MKTNETISEQQHINCILPYPISEKQWNYYYNFSWWTVGIGAICVGLLGIVFNFVTITVVLGSKLAAIFLLASPLFNLFDILFLLNGVLEAFTTYMRSTPLHNYLFVKFLSPFRSVVKCCSIYMTII